ncbi:hypothetical protein VPHD69_0057 [Vibrio phage D69]
MTLTKVTNRMIDGAAVNVRDFGAVGDGVTDDTAAFKEAFKWGKIFVPSGTYLITDTLQTPRKDELQALLENTRGILVDEYSFVLEGEGVSSKLLFDLSSVDNVGKKHAFALGSHDINSTDYSQSGSYHLGTVGGFQRNINISNISFFNNPLADTNSENSLGISLLNTSGVFCNNVFVEGFSVNWHLFTWVSHFSSCRGVGGRYGWVSSCGTSTALTGCFAGGQETGYMFGEQPDFLGSGPGGIRPYGYVLTSCAADFTTETAYRVDEVNSVIFNGCGSEHAETNMFQINGPISTGVTIDSPTISGVSPSGAIIHYGNTGDFGNLIVQNFKIWSGLNVNGMFFVEPAAEDIFLEYTTLINTSSNPSLDAGRLSNISYEKMSKIMVGKDDRYYRIPYSDPTTESETVFTIPEDVWVGMSTERGNTGGPAFDTRLFTFDYVYDKTGFSGRFYTSVDIVVFVDGSTQEITIGDQKSEVILTGSGPENLTFVAQVDSSNNLTITPLKSGGDASSVIQRHRGILTYTGSL